LCHRATMAVEAESRFVKMYLFNRYF